MALAELVAGMKKPTVSLVLGGGHSIGVPLAVAAKKSFIAPSATMTIHPVRMNGLMLGVPQTLDYFQRMPGPDYPVCYAQFPHFTGAVYPSFHEYPGTGNGCGDCAGRR